MKYKHAYLIMAHHQFDILELILKDLDDERNDIFLHIDKKSKNYSLDFLQNCIQKSKLYIIPSMDISWGGYSQIKCILALLKAATSTFTYDYYHFMVGVEFPLKSQDYIHHFFEENDGKEFIGFDPYDYNFEERVRFYHIFNGSARKGTLLSKIQNFLRKLFLKIQKLARYDRLKGTDMILKKGNANWSITNQLAVFIISKQEEIKKIYKHSFCADEVFIHTLVYNSLFYERVYDKKDEFLSNMRIVQWNNSQNVYHKNDLPFLINSGRLFARKFDGREGIEMINSLLKNRKK